jgi:hypothetical protein
MTALFLWKHSMHNAKFSSQKITQHFVQLFDQRNNDIRFVIKNKVLFEERPLILKTDFF